MPILMSRDNPTGAKLEDLLDQVAAELEGKTQSFVTDSRTTSL